MFSEMTRMRSVCARMPDAAMSMEAVKSIAVLLAGRLAERGAHELHRLGVEIGRGLELALCVGDLDHLLFERDRVAVGAGRGVRRLGAVEAAGLGRHCD